MVNKIGKLGIRKIRHIIQCSECKSFTEAATNNNISQPALAVMIKELEDLLGYDVFERINKTRTTQPTKRGQKILAAFYNIINAYDYEMSKLTEMEENNSKKKRIIIQNCFSSGINHDWLQHLIASLDSANVILETGERSDIIDAITKRNATIGIVDDLNQPESIDFVRLGSISMNMTLIVPESIDVEINQEGIIDWTCLPRRTLVTDFEGTHLRKYIHNQLNFCGKQISDYPCIKSQTFLRKAVIMKTRPILMPSLDAEEFQDISNLHSYKMTGPGVNVNLMMVMPWGHLRSIDLRELRENTAIMVA